MKRIVLVFLTVAALFSLGFAEVYTFPSVPGASGFNLINQDNAGVEIEFNVPRMSMEALDIDGQNMSVVSIPGVFLPNNAGAPNLPGNGEIIAIPQGATAGFQVLSDPVRER